MKLNGRDFCIPMKARAEQELHLIIFLKLRESQRKKGYDYEGTHRSCVYDYPLR
jgi:hypothetical protein